MPSGARPLWLAARQNGAPAALLPLMALKGGTLTSLTSPYTILYQPLLAPGTSPFDAGRALGQTLRRWPLTRLEALDPAWPALAPFLAGLRRAGLVPRAFDHFGNWFEDTDGIGWEAYLESRPSPLRNTIRRRLRAVEKLPEIRCQIVQAPGEVEAALAAYETVYAKSWKEPEPFPRFNPVLLPALAREGALRMAVLWRDDAVLAAQYWTVDDGVATVLKLAHDEAAKALSPGTVLTAIVVRTLLGEGIRALDFGRGDDPYKRGWTEHRRQRTGVVLATPWRPDGMAVLARHWLGAVRRSVVRPAPTPNPT